MNARRTRVAPRPTSRRSSRRNHDIRMGVPLIVLGTVLIGGLIGAYAFFAGSRVELNADTGCPLKGPFAVTAILFDRTDPINDKQKLYLQNKLDSFRGTTQKYEEVDTYSLEDQGDGVVTPSARTPDQTQIALFWVEASPVAWNRIARTVSAAAGLNLWENARLFALLNLALADGYIGSFEAKYLTTFGDRSQPFVRLTWMVMMLRPATPRGRP